MSVYLFIGGAYGDHRRVQIAPPDSDQLKLWSAGELEIFKIDSELRVYEPDGGSGMWALIPQTPKEAA